MATFDRSMTNGDAGAFDLGDPGRAFDVEVEVQPELLMSSAELLAYTSQRVQKRLTDLRAELVAAKGVEGDDEFGQRFAAAFWPKVDEMLDAADTVTGNGEELANRLDIVGQGYRDSDTAAAETFDQATTDPPG